MSRFFSCICISSELVSTMSATRRLLDHVVSNLKSEWNLLKRPIVFGTIIFTGLVQWMHSAAHNLVYYVAGQYGVFGGNDNTLTDLGFIGIEKILPDMTEFSNSMLFTMAGLAVAVCGSVLFTNYLIQDTKLRMMGMLVRACWVCCIAVFLRVVSFLITILPAPAPHCAKATFNPPKTTSDIIFKFDLGGGCSDLLFSSHQLYGLVAACAMHHYLVVGNKAFKNTPKLQRAIQISLLVIGWVIVLVEGLAIIRQKRHYSIDIFTAFYAVPLTWMSIAYLFPNDVADAKQNKKEVENNKDTDTTTSTV